MEENVVLGVHNHSVSSQLQYDLLYVVSTTCQAAMCVQERHCVSIFSNLLCDLCENHSVPEWTTKLKPLSEQW